MPGLSLGLAGFWGCGVMTRSGLPSHVPQKDKSGRERASAKLVYRLGFNPLNRKP